MTGSLLSFLWPALGTFAVLCPFQAHLLLLALLMCCVGALSLHSRWAELGLYIYLTLHLLLSCSALNLFPITCTLTILS